MRQLVGATVPTRMGGSHVAGRPIMNGAYRIAEGVLLTDSAITTALRAVETAQWARQRDGLPASRDLELLRQLLSPPGHADSQKPAEV